MVEMLAVIAVMAIIVALVVPNGIFARTAAEESTAKAQGAALEMAMGNWLLSGGAKAKTDWATFKSTNPNLQQVVTQLVSVGALPPTTSVASVTSALAGYDVSFPAALSSGISITRTGGDQIYP